MRNSRKRRTLPQAERQKRLNRFKLFGEGPNLSRFDACGASASSRFRLFDRFDAIPPQQLGHGMKNRCTNAQSTEVARRWAPPIVTLAATAALTVLTAAPRADAAPRQAPPEHTTEGAAPRNA